MREVFLLLRTVSVVICDSTYLSVDTKIPELVVPTGIYLENSW